MPFKFRLEKVLSLRREDVERAQRVVIQAKKALEEAEKRLQIAIADLKFKQEELIRENYRMAEDHMRGIKKAQDHIENVKKQLLMCQNQLEEAKKALLEAQKRLEAMEKLKEKQAEEYLLEETRIEQKQSDEKAALKFAVDMMQKQIEDSEEQV